MSSSLRMAASAVFIALGIGILNAQTNTGNPPGTNVAQVVSIALGGVKANGDSNSVAVTITQKDVLSALNAAGGFNFDRTAVIVFVSHEDQQPTIWVREGIGANQTFVDISDFFTITQPVEVDANHNLISYAVRIFSFDDHNGTAFTVQGVMTLRRQQITSRIVGPLLRVATAQASVSGDGTLKGDPVVLHGTISAGSPQVEVN